MQPINDAEVFLCTGLDCVVRTKTVGADFVFPAVETPGMFTVIPFKRGGTSTAGNLSACTGISQQTSVVLSTAALARQDLIITGK